MTIRDYLRLESPSDPIRYNLAIYVKLKLEMTSELLLGGITAPEDVQEILERYNDKWNDIRNEYMTVYDVDDSPLPEDLYRNLYSSEMSDPHLCRDLNHDVQALPYCDDTLIEEVVKFSFRL